MDAAELWLPSRMGGCGATSARARMAAAPWATWGAAMSEVLTHMGVDSVEELFERVPSIGEELGRMHQRLVDQGTLPSLAYSSPAQAIAIKRPLRTLVAHVHKTALRSLRAGMNDSQAAFLRSASGPSAGAFLEPPLDDRWVLTNQRFRIATLRRLGVPYPMLPQAPATPPVCPKTTAQGRTCGKACDAHGMHLECCAPEGALIARHDAIVRCIGVLAARALDPKPKLEQIIPELARPVHGQMGQARLDVVVHDGVSRALLDVVVVSPYASNASFTASCAGATDMHPEGLPLQNGQDTLRKILCRLLWRLEAA